MTLFSTFFLRNSAARVTCCTLSGTAHHQLSYMSTQLQDALQMIQEKRDITANSQEVAEDPVIKFKSTVKAVK